MLYNVIFCFTHSILLLCHLLFLLLRIGLVATFWTCILFQHLWGALVYNKLILFHRAVVRFTVVMAIVVAIAVVIFFVIVVVVFFHISYFCWCRCCAIFSAVPYIPLSHRLIIRGYSLYYYQKSIVSIATKTHRHKHNTHTRTCAHTHSVKIYLVELYVLKCFMAGPRVIQF